MVELLTANRVSPNMWKLMSILYTVFTSEGGYDYFGGWGWWEVVCVCVCACVCVCVLDFLLYCITDVH